MFHKNGKLYCEDCFEKTEKEHDLIIEYVRKYPDSTILDIITETGVTLKSINTLVEDGYVSYIENKLKPVDREESTKVENRPVAKKSQFHIRRNLY